MDDWIEWDGSSHSPIPPHTLIEVRFRNGETMYSSNTYLSWGHTGSYGDVMAYRLTGEAAEIDTYIPLDYDIFTRISDWASTNDFIQGCTSQALFMKLVAELGGVAECIIEDKPVNVIQKEIGDVLTVLVILANHYGLNPLDCAEVAYNKFKDINDAFVK